MCMHMLTRDVYTKLIAGKATNLTEFAQLSLAYLSNGRFIHRIDMP